MGFTVEFEIEFPARINISCIVNGDALDAANLANQQVIDLWGSEVTFKANGGDARPHITMLMGVVESVSHYQRLYTRLAYLAAHTTPLSYRLGQPYSPSDRSGFVFSAVEPNDLFRAKRVEIASSVKGLIHLDVHGGPENDSHITLGYAIQRPFTISKLDSGIGGTEGTATAWQSSVVGRRGTSVTLLDSFSLIEDQAMPLQ